MARPNKLGVPYRSRHIILPEQWDDWLRIRAQRLTEEYGREVSVSELVRETLSDRWGSDLIWTKEEYGRPNTNGTRAI